MIIPRLAPAPSPTPNGKTRRAHERGICARHETQQDHNREHQGWRFCSVAGAMCPAAHGAGAPWSKPVHRTVRNLWQQPISRPLSSCVSVVNTDTQATWRLALARDWTSWLQKRSDHPILVSVLDTFRVVSETAKRMLGVESFAAGTLPSSANAPAKNPEPGGRLASARGRANTHDSPFHRGIGGRQALVVLQPLAEFQAAWSPPPHRSSSTSPRATVSARPTPNACASHLSQIAPAGRLVSSLTRD
jgi:hypothetical protein